MKYSSNYPPDNCCTHLDLLKQYGFLGKRRGPTLIPNLIWGYLNSLVAQMVKNPPAMQETWVWSLGQEDSLEKGMATHFSILAWKTPWTEEPCRLLAMGSQSQTWLSNWICISIISLVKTRPYQNKNLKFITFDHSVQLSLLTTHLCFGHYTGREIYSS